MLQSLLMTTRKDAIKQVKKDRDEMVKWKHAEHELAERRQSIKERQNSTDGAARIETLKLPQMHVSRKPETSVGHQHSGTCRRELFPKTCMRGNANAKNYGPICDRARSLRVQS